MLRISLSFSACNFSSLSAASSSSVLLLRLGVERRALMISWVFIEIPPQTHSGKWYYQQTSQLTKGLHTHRQIRTKKSTHPLRNIHHFLTEIKTGTTFLCFPSFFLPPLEVATKILPCSVIPSVHTLIILKNPHRRHTPHTFQSAGQGGRSMILVHLAL